MKVNLRRMSKLEFEEFRKESIRDYALDLMKSSGVSADEALLRATREFTDMLPDGIDTMNHEIRIIENDPSGHKVGVIWFVYEEGKNMKNIFLSDFVIDEPERRRGYATAALEMLEREGRERGCKENRLFVWKHNESGIALYRKCGYEIYRDETHGLYMKKNL